MTRLRGDIWIGIDVPNRLWKGDKSGWQRKKKRRGRDEGSHEGWGCVCAALNRGRRISQGGNEFNWSKKGKNLIT